MENKNKKIKFDIDNGQAFFADEVGIIHNPLRIMLDFRSVTPRIDVRNQEYQPLILKHNLIVMDPYMAKTLSEMLKSNLANYEKQYGKIKKPEQLKKLEKTKSKKAKGEEPEKVPPYLG